MELGGNSLKENFVRKTTIGGKFQGFLEKKCKRKLLLEEILRRILGSATGRTYFGAEEKKTILGYCVGYRVGDQRMTF